MCMHALMSPPAPHTQLLFHVHLLRFTTAAFPNDRAGFRFWNPSGAADRGSRGEAGSSTQNRWLPLSYHHTKKRVERRKKKTPTPPVAWHKHFYLLAVHTNPICSTYQHTCTCQHRGLPVWPAGVTRTKRSNEIKLAERQRLLLITANRWRFSLWSLMMGEMQKRGDIKDSAELFSEWVMIRQTRAKDSFTVPPGFKVLRVQADTAEQVMCCARCHAGMRPIVFWWF